LIQSKCPRNASTDSLIVNEDTVDDRLLDLSIAENDRDFLVDVQQNLPLVADILRADLLVYCPDGTGTSAVAVAAAAPRTAPSIHSEPVLGKRVTEVEEPAVFRALRNGKRERERSRSLDIGAQFVQDVFPIIRGDKVVGALSVEISQIEHERWRKKSAVLRNAVDQLRRMLLHGQIYGGDSIGPLGEHDAPLVVDSEGRILYISGMAENLYRKLGYSNPLINSNLRDLNTDESVPFDALETGTCVERLVEQGPLVWLVKAIPIAAQPKRSRRFGFFLRDREIEGVLLLIRDTTEERKKERELLVKSAMIREVHHRVKNNLQTIAALLRLQARRIHSEEAADSLNQSINRILSIAVVHEFLSRDESSIIDIKEMCQRIIAEVTQGILDPEKNIDICLEGQNIYLPSQQATSCALIINELLQNAVEHGFSARVDGKVVVKLEDLGNDLVVEIADNGQGLGQGFRVGAGSSLGLQIVQTLAKEDLKGSFELFNGEGARAVVTFPKLWRDQAPHYSEFKLAENSEESARRRASGIGTNEGGHCRR